MKDLVTIERVIWWVVEHSLLWGFDEVSEIFILVGLVLIYGLIYWLIGCGFEFVWLSWESVNSMY